MHFNSLVYIKMVSLVVCVIVYTDCTGSCRKGVKICWCEVPVDKLWHCKISILYYIYTVNLSATFFVCIFFQHVNKNPISKMKLQMSLASCHVRSNYISFVNFRSMAVNKILINVLIKMLLWLAFNLFSEQY